MCGSGWLCLISFLLFACFVLLRTYFFHKKAITSNYIEAYESEFNFMQQRLQQAAIPWNVKIQPSCESERKWEITLSDLSTLPTD